MPFPVEEQYIKETEKSLNIKLSTSFKNLMKKNNGGTIITDDDYWEIYPFFDKSDRKRLSRTCNHILKETLQAKEWSQFPSNAIAIANNGNGDLLVFLHENDISSDTIYLWSHELGTITKVADSFDLLNIE